MDRQIVIKPFGDRFHICFHNYMGAFEGRQIGKWLELEEVETPHDDDAWKELETGQYFLWHVMDRHPDLHTILPASRLKDVARVMDHFHVRAVEGGELLPELAPEEREQHSDHNYIAYLEHEHEPPWKKGPRALIGAIVVRTVPALVVFLGLMVGAQHWGDHREDVGLEEVFRRVSRPAEERSWFAALVSPDHSHLVRTTVSSIRFMQGERIILEDGQVLRFAGLGDVRPMLHAARDHYTVPQIEIDVGTGAAHIERVVVGPQQFAHDTQLVREAKLPPSSDEPARSTAQDTDGWWLCREVGRDDSAELDGLVGRRVSLEGTLVPHGETWMLRGGRGLEFEVDFGRDVRGGEELLVALADGATELIADIVPEDYDRDSGRGTAELYSVTAQNYHLVARF